MTCNYKHEGEREPSWEPSWEKPGEVYPGEREEAEAKTLRKEETATFQQVPGDDEERASVRDKVKRALPLECCEPNSVNVATPGPIAQVKIAVTDGKDSGLPHPAVY